MIITETRVRRGQLYLLVLDGEPAMTVDRRTFDESPYKTGALITDEQLRELLEESRRRRAKEKALYLLSMRDHSKAELERKLSAEAGKDVAAQTAERLEELGLVNDEDYARRLARDLRLRRHYPLRRAVQEMQSRGVSRDLAQLAAQEVETDDTQQALELLRKKYYNKLHTDDERRKTTAALARLGFGYEDIRRAMREYDDGEITDEWPIE